MAATAVLRRFQIQVYRPVLGTPTTMVPAAANIAFYKQGATIAATVPDVPYTDPALIDPTNPDPPPATEVPVWHAGTIKTPLEILQYDTNSAAVLTLTQVDDADPRNVKLYLWNTSIQPSLTLVAYRRILRLGSRPAAYLDPTGAVAPIPAVPYLDTDPATGRAGGYLRDFQYDCLVSGIGLTAVVVPDALGSFEIR